MLWPSSTPSDSSLQPRGIPKGDANPVGAGAPLPRARVASARDSSLPTWSEWACQEGLLGAVGLLSPSAVSAPSALQANPLAAPQREAAGAWRPFFKDRSREPCRHVREEVSPGPRPFSEVFSEPASARSGVIVGMRASVLRAYGRDRLEQKPDETFHLFSPVSKGWIGRKPGTQTSAEHPGTAVDWENEVFEVVAAEPLPSGGMRYLLARWEERHTIRVLERYDEAGEKARAGFRRELAGGERRRKLSALFAPILGHLPGPVQERMEKEFGAPALLMTILAAFPLFVVGFLSLFGWLVASFGAGFSPERGKLVLFEFLAWIPLPLALFLFAESAVRLASAVAAGKPCGSLVGVLGYEVWRTLRGRETEPRRPADSSSASPAAARALQDRFHLLEPLLALLTPREQEMLAWKFGFDPILWGKRTATGLLIVTALNVLISLGALAAGTGGVGDFLWLVGGTFFLMEQLARRRALSRGEPAGSLLGALVRPLARGILAPEK